MNEILILLRSSITNLVHPIIKIQGEKMLQHIVKTLNQYNSENLRDINKDNLKNLMQTVERLA